MLHLVFNFHDPVVQLRLSATLAVLIMIICLGIYEFKRDKPKRMLVSLAVAFTLGGAVLLYTIAVLKGA